MGSGSASPPRALRPAWPRAASSLDRHGHDKLAALTVLLKHLGGFPDERPAEVINNTLNVITDEQRIAAVMSLLARARETTIDCAQEPAEQSPALVQKPH
jgi:hypothetical protein